MCVVAYVAELLGSHQGFQVTFRSSIWNVGLLLRRCSGQGPHPWTAAHQVSLSFTTSWSLLKLMSVESVMSSNHLILCHPVLLMPSIFPSVRVFSNELALCIRQNNTLLFEKSR